MGIMVGDGHVGIYESLDKKRYHYSINISGNLKDELHMDFVNKLFFDVFNIKLHKDIIKNKNCVVLRKQSRAMALFFRNLFDIQNNKSNISVPNLILDSTFGVKAAFLRGLADSDFCITIKYKPNAYPIIHGTSKSRLLINQCSDMLKEFGIENFCREEVDYYEKRDKTYTRHRVYISGFKRVAKYMDLIGFSNENKVKKYNEALKRRNISTIKHTPKK